MASVMLCSYLDGVQYVKPGGVIHSSLFTSMSRDLVYLNTTHEISTPCIQPSSEMEQEVLTKRENIQGGGKVPNFNSTAVAP